MKQVTRASMIAALILTSAFVFSCSDTESRVPYYLKTAKVIINLGLPADHASAGTSIIDRVLRFFASDAVAQSAPATFGSILVRVTGPGMGPIEKTFSANSSISLEVPAGNLRQFEVIAYVAPGDPSAAASFRGTGAANLPAGSTVSIIVAMSLYETKIVVPDTMGHKIVALDSFSDATPILINRDTIEYTGGILYPNDIDFDSRGRIYIANSSGSSMDPCLLRMENLDSTITDSTCFDFTSISMQALRAMAIDRKREIIYVSNSGNQLFARDYNDNVVGPDVYATTNISQIWGLAVEEATGNLYMACLYYNGFGFIPSIVRYNPDSQSLILPYYELSSGEAWDVTIWGGKVYAAEYIGGSGNVVQLPMNLDTMTTPPEYLSTKPDDTDSFQGPHRFVAISPRRLYIIDEYTGDMGSQTERIVSFTDISGSGWTIYPEPPQSLFYFFDIC